MLIHVEVPPGTAYPLELPRVNLEHLNVRLCVTKLTGAITGFALKGNTRLVEPNGARAQAFGTLFRLFRHSHTLSLLSRMQRQHR